MWVSTNEVIVKDTFLSVTLSDSSFFSVPRNSLTFISALNAALDPPVTAILTVALHNDHV